MRATSADPSVSPSSGEPDAPAPRSDSPPRPLRAPRRPRPATAAAHLAASSRRPRALRPSNIAPSAAAADQHVVVVSGLSGAGKTAATKLFEDLGYTCVDNLPGELLPDFAELVSSDPERFAKVAVVLDVRAGDAPLAFGAMRGALEGRGIRPQVFFLEVRFMQNPYYVESLRQLSGRAEAVRAFVLDQSPARRFLAFVSDFLDFAVPAYVAEGKTRLAIAIGCTGGYHRSIVIAEEMATW